MGNWYDDNNEFAPWELKKIFKESKMENSSITKALLKENKISPHVLNCILQLYLFGEDKERPNDIICDNPPNAWTTWTAIFEIRKNQKQIKKESKMKIKGMMPVQKDLPEVNKDVICFGIDNEGETKVEEGFRSEVDKDNKPHEWADFSYTVTHWIYSPVIEVE